MAAGIAARFAGTALGRALAPQLAKWAPQIKAAAPHFVPFVNPANPTWGGIGRGLALGAVPEALGGTMLAASLPAGTPWTDRALALGQEVAVGTLASTVGSGGVSMGLRRAGLGDETTQAIRMVADPALYMGASMLVPNMGLNRAMQREEGRLMTQQREQEALRQQQEQLERQQLAESVRAQTEQEILSGLLPW
jgi:hypothetical protein